MYLAPERFAATMGIGLRAAQKAFLKAAQGKPWKGQHLPVVALDGHGVGAGGKVWGLALDRCSPELRAKFRAFEGPFEARVESTLNGRLEPWQWQEQQDRLRIIAPMIGLEKRAPERAEAFRAVAAMRHFIRGNPTIVSEKTLRDWVRLHELHGPGALIPGTRGDKGKARVLFTREWDAGIDLPFDKRAAIAARLTREARSMVGIDGTSIRVCFGVQN
jgi:hypothetical protein